MTAGARNYNIYWKYQASVLGVTGKSGNPSALHPPTSSTAAGTGNGAEGAEGSAEAATSCNGAFLGFFGQGIWGDHSLPDINILLEYINSNEIGILIPINTLINIP